MSILPISKQDLDETVAQDKAEAEADNVKIVSEATEAEEPISSEDEEDVEPKELFEKPQKKKAIVVEVEPKEELTKTGRKKRKMTEAQLENLKKAREKSRASRLKLKEARDMEQQIKKEERKLKKQAKIDKKEQAEELLSIKAKMQMEANSNATWDEERLSKLMFNTIDTYMTKRKEEKAKPQPRVVIPNQNQYSQMPNHYQPNNYNVVPQQNYNQHNQPRPQQGNGRSAGYNTTMNDLFGFTD